MRKGENTRQEIIRVAEDLFCRNGYEATSIQNILDILHASKGAFYHHFISKEALLRAIFEQHAKATSSRVKSVSQHVSDPLARLDQVIQLLIPLHVDEVPFISTLIPILDRTESASVLQGWQNALAESCGHSLQEAVDACAEHEVLFPVSAGMVQPILALIQQSWRDVILLILENARMGRRVSSAMLLEPLNLYRRCLEALLGAPFGSLTLLRLDDLSTFAELAYQRIASEVTVSQ